MTKEKIKTFIFDSDVVYKQIYVPFVFLLFFFIIREMPETFFDNNVVEFILIAIPLNIIWIYPIFSFIWCTVNYIYKKRKNSLDKIDSKSLVRSMCILAVDSYIMFTLYMMAHLGI